MNTLPEITLPEGLNVLGGGGWVPVTGVTVSDADGDILTVTLSAAGLLTLGQTAGLSFLEGDGADDTRMVFRGSADDINAALAGLMYLPPLSGISDTIDLSVSDSGGSGSQSGFGSFFDVSQLYESNGGDGSRGFVVTNSVETLLADGNFLFNVSIEGDINGDGYSDLIIGWDSSKQSSGAVVTNFFAVYGGDAASLPEISLGDLSGGVGSRLFRIDYANTDPNSDIDYVLNSLGVGDFNGDGIDDIIVGIDPLEQPYWGPEEIPGSASIVFGTLEGWPEALNLSLLDGDDGFVVSREEPFDRHGSDVSSVGDFNGDGIDDFIVLAQNATIDGVLGAGEAYVFFGRNSAFPPSTDASALNGSNGFRIGIGDVAFTVNADGSKVSNGILRRVGSAGDLNGDGLDDIVLSYNVDVYGSEWRNSVIFGTRDTSTDIINLSAMDRSAGFTFGSYAFFFERNSEQALGDVNGDGIDDLALSGPYSSIYIVYGSMDGFAEDLDLESLDGSNGFKIFGGIETSTYSYFGENISGAGDVNGDGINDILIGSMLGQNEFTGPNPGIAYVIFGSNAATDPIVDVTALDATEGFAIGGSSGNFYQSSNGLSYLGSTVSGGGDLNGDGVGDLVVTAPGAGDGGHAYVIYGQSTAPSAAINVFVSRTLDDILANSELHSITSHLALFSEGAYENGSNSMDVETISQLESYGWTLYSLDTESQFFSVEDLVDIQPIGDNSAYELNGYAIESGNAQIILGRTDDAIVISFRGTDEFADKIDWFRQAQYYDALLPLVNRILDMVAADEEITDVYFTGHSLGAGMAEIFYATHSTSFEAIRDIEVHAQNFASPGYNATAADELAAVILATREAGLPGFVAALAGLTGLALLTELFEQIRNADSPVLTTWVALDTIGVASFFSANIGQPFDVSFSTESFSDEIAGDTYGAPRRHAPDLYGDIPQVVDLAISSNPDLLNMLRLSIADGSIFQDYDRLIVRADYQGSGQWDLGMDVEADGVQDTLSVTDYFTTSHILLGHQGEDILSGGEAGDLLLGLDGDDTLIGDGFSAESVAYQGIRIGGADILDGGDGNDTASYEYSAGVYIDLRIAPSFNGIIEDLGSQFSNAGGALGDLLFNIENVIGSRYEADTIHGDGMNNQIEGLGGNDVLYGHGGNDTLIAGVGGTTFDDDLYGGAGNDKLYTEGGQDYLSGGAGDDSYFVFDVTESRTFLKIDEVADDTNADRLELDMAYELDDLRLSYRDGNLVITVQKDFLEARFFSFDIVVIGGASISALETITFGSGDSALDLVAAFAAYEAGIGSAVSDYFGISDALLSAGGGTVSGGGGFDTADFSSFGTSQSAPQNPVVPRAPGSGIEIIFTAAGTGVVRIAGAADIQLDSIEGIITGRTNDQITADALANVIEAGGGADRVDGGAGDDLIIDRIGSGNDIYEGGEGIDTVDYSDALGAILVDLSLVAGRASGADIGTDALSGIEAVISGAGADTITGNGETNYLSGLAGNDTLDGGAGADFLYGGTGNDILFGGDGVDQLFGEEGDDSLYGGFQNDILLGEGGNDFIAGGEGDDAADGGDGDDRLFGEGGDDVLRGGAGADYLVGNEGNDLLVGGAGNDRVQGREGNDRVYGETGDDELRGGEGDDYLVGNEGNDVLLGENGNDNLQGREGDDVLNGGVGNDRLIGGSGLDTADYSAFSQGVVVNLATGTVSKGAFGIDTIQEVEAVIGSSATDELRGSAAAEVFYGGDGFDLIASGAGDDILYGGAGNDRIFAEDGDDIIYGGDGDDYLVGNAGDDIMYGEAGDDNLQGREGNDTMYGGIGNDQFYGLDGNDALYGEDGDDFLAGYSGSDVIYGGAGNDRFFGMLDDDTLYGGDGDDFLIANEGNDKVYGDAGNDNLRGRDGDDVLFGGDGNDFILGDEGNDRIGGDGGFDTLYGGSGLDTFVFEGDWRRDTVADWAEGETLDLSTLGLQGASETDADAFAKLTLVQDGATAIISVTGDTRNDIRLLNTDISSLDAADFDFGFAGAGSTPAAVSEVFGWDEVPEARNLPDSLDLLEIDIYRPNIALDANGYWSIDADDGLFA